jgi:hypothetical protein
MRLKNTRAEAAKQKEKKKEVQPRLPRTRAGADVA